jgi:hypothetical protein
MKRTSFLFVLATLSLILVGCGLFGPPQNPFLYEERFSQSEGNSWYVSEGEVSKCWIGDGKYHFELKENKYLPTKNSAAGEYDDYQLDIDLYHIEGTNNKSVGGVIFRLVDWDNYYEFLVSPAGTFKFRKQVENNWVDITGWTSSDAIVQGVGTNHLTVVADGSLITLYVNDEQVYSGNDSSFSTGQIGVAVLSYTDNVEWMHVAFDNITVQALD